MAHIKHGDDPVEFAGTGQQPGGEQLFLRTYEVVKLQTCVILVREYASLSILDLIPCPCPQKLQFLSQAILEVAVRLH